MEAFGVVATAAASGRSVVFVEGGVRRAAGRRALPPSDAVKGIDYRAAEVGVDHVLASAAIPLVFPPKRVEEPKRAAGWYLDGGTRLNTPIKPALALQVERVAIVASDPAEHGEPEPRGGGPAEHGRPDFDDALLHLLQAVMADPLMEDVWRLAEVNRLVETGGGAGKQVNPYLFGGPERRGAIGARASSVWQANYGSVTKLLFDPDFMQALIELGERDARVTAGWRTSPLVADAGDGGASRAAAGPGAPPSPAPGG